jgi:hypothetical protein
VTDEEYQQEYQKAAAELEAAATKATTARGPDGRFAKVEAQEQPQETAQPVATPEVKAEPAKEPEQQAQEPAKVDDPLAEMRTRLEKAEKMARDNQAWATKAAQEAAALRREREQEQRAKAKPAILDANPELAEAIRYVTTDPTPKQPGPNDVWRQAVESAHPGIFTVPDEDELVKSIAARAARDASEWGDPFGAIRIITEEKLAHGERQLGKRFAAEAAKLAQKSAMSVPGAGAGSAPKGPVDAQLAEVQRIQSMSQADFEKEVRRVKGF